MSAVVPAGTWTSMPCWTIRQTRILVCCGSGGVGKTTTAAALGAASRRATDGRRTVVLTIDPARRLAQSMGLVELDNTPAAGAGGRRRQGLGRARTR